MCPYLVERQKYRLRHLWVTWLYDLAVEIRGTSEKTFHV
jgi:hypothetical protein